MLLVINGTTVVGSSFNDIAALLCVGGCILCNNINDFIHDGVPLKHSYCRSMEKIPAIRGINLRINIVYWVSQFSLFVKPWRSSSALLNLSDTLIYSSNWQRTVYNFPNSGVWAALKCISASFFGNTVKWTRGTFIFFFNHLRSDLTLENFEIY